MKIVIKQHGRDCGVWNDDGTMMEGVIAITVCAVYDKISQVTLTRRLSKQDIVIVDDVEIKDGTPE